MHVHRRKRQLNPDTEENAVNEMRLAELMRAQKNKNGSIRMRFRLNINLLDRNALTASRLMGEKTTAAQTTSPQTNKKSRISLSGTVAQPTSNKNTEARRAILCMWISWNTARTHAYTSRTHETAAPALNVAYDGAFAKPVVASERGCRHERSCIAQFQQRYMARRF